jgi:hypothetical protein
MNDYIHPYLEWEVLQEPTTIPEVDNKKELPEGQKEIRITRDEYYNLRAVLSTECHPKTKDVGKCGFVELFEITGSNLYDMHYTLESCNCAGYKPRGRLYEIDLCIQGLKIRHQTETEGAWLTEWYINGPENNSVFRNSTKRKSSKTIVRERLAHNDEKIHFIEVSGEDLYSSRDYLRIETGDLQFLIAKVPEGFGPNWHSNISSNIGIEYRKDWGRIPDENEREVIRELCSFIFGRQLLMVGYTSYDKDNNIVEEYACNPWGNDPRYLCSKPDIPPIRIEGHSKADDLISKLLPTYCELRDDYHLDDGLWAYWVACDMPVGLDLPTFAASVEAIMNGWFEFEMPEFDRNNKVYMDKDEFKELFRDELSSVEGKLLKCWFSWNNIPGDGNERFIKLFRKYFDIDWVENAKIYKSDDGKTIHIIDGENSAKITIYKGEGKATLKISDGRVYDLEFKRENGKRNIYIESRPYSYKIVNNLQNEYKMGVMDQFRFFFDKIDLVPDDREWDAIKARNKVAHGRFIISHNSEESGRMLQHGLAYTTIIHKILLRLMGYSGRYRDYSDGFKDKQLKSNRDHEDSL